MAAGRPMSMAGRGGYE